ncbi:PRC-barrel domain containing protein [Aliihoeflea aestuarii]|uniref:PRC-barrel domain-containing protein n=1 Tax=Aliihoeflea aestuarii TaxID=453840 RepID=UPI002093B14C|nr:PRC-barrel domain-containing protein [Aliihoeflea aestuarii]MCO6389788.1 PRC-barrel domain containing protein [Aliihoeflea aestuarii]
MIRTLLATTAIAALLTTGAMAQTTAPAEQDPAAAPMTDTAPAEAVETPGPEAIEGHLATNIIGETVYNGVGDDAENIGTINDIVLDTEGRADLIVVGVGGFLGLGQKDVALEYAEIEWAQRDDGSVWLVVPTTREQLEQQEAFDRDLYDPSDPASMAATGAAATAPAATDDAAAPADDAAATDGMAAAPATDDAAGDDAATDSMATAPAEGTETDDMAAAPTTDETQTAAIDRSTLTEVDAAGLSADELIGTTVYGANDENVGSISDVILDGDAVDAVTIDVGGFLGMGAKNVAVDMDNLAFMTDEDGEYYLYTSFTEEQLEAQPEYDEATFADQRDDQLLVNPAN